MARIIAPKLFIFFLAVYLLTASGLNFYHIDASELHTEVTRSLIERFDLSVSEKVGIRGADGRYYSWLGIGYAFLAVPFYVIGELIGTPEIVVSVINQMVGAATAVLIFLFSICLGYSKRSSILVSVLYGLATIAWPLAKQPFDHVLETFLVLLSVYFIYRYIANKKSTFLLLSGIFLGIAFITRLTSLLVVPSLFIMIVVYYLKRHDFKTTVKLTIRDILLFSLAFLPFMFLNLWYNYYRFGSIFETGYSLMAERMGINFFTNTLLIGLGGFLISPGKGFFYYSPVAILFFFSIKPFLKKHLLLGISFIVIILSYLLFLSKYIIWHGDWAWGPRYLLVITPFLVITIAELLDSDIWMKKGFFNAIICLIITVSFLIQVTAISVDFNKYFLDLRIDKKVDFTIVHGEGVQPIIEPPIETYFDWHRSPILSQFKFINESIRNLKTYRYSKPTDISTFNDKLRADPALNVFDFWWLYIHFVDGSYSGFVVFFMLLFVTFYYALRLRELSRDT